MFQINELNGELHVFPLINGGEDAVVQYNTIENPVEVTVIGKNSVFDSNLSQYFAKRTINFKGTIYAPLKDEIKLKIYKLEQDCGYLVHNEKDNIVYISRSFSLLNDYCLALKLSLVGIIVKNCPGFKLQSIPINNDFCRTPVTTESIDVDNNINFDFEWTENDLQIPIGMIIDAANFNIDKDNMFYTDYTGTAVNIGKFRQIIVKELDNRYPDLFLEWEFNRCIVLTDLFDDNIFNVLGTKVITQSECRLLIDHMLRTERTNLVFSGVSSSGYGVQAHLVLLDESERTPNYQVRVSKLILSPSASFAKDISVYDR